MFQVYNGIKSLNSFLVFLQWRMNGLSFSEVCCLFCCPPCPSRIAAKLAFLPPEPTYTFLPDPETAPPASGLGTTTTRARSSAAVSGAGNVEGRWKLHLTERAEFQYSQRELDTTEVLLTRSARGNRIGCMYIRCVPNARWALLSQFQSFPHSFLQSPLSFGVLVSTQPFLRYISNLALGKICSLFINVTFSGRTAMPRSEWGGQEHSHRLCS